MLQKRAARIITNSDYTLRSSDTFQKLSWEPLDLILKKRYLFMTFKAINGMLPEYVTQLFHTCENTGYVLRRRSSNFKLSQPKPKTNFLINSFSYRGAAYWNNIPINLLKTVRESTSLKTVHYLLDHHILSISK
jgi:hypothetical protein